MSNFSGIAVCLTPSPSTSNWSFTLPVQSGAANCSLPFCCERTDWVWKYARPWVRSVKAAESSTAKLVLRAETRPTVESS